MTAWNAPPPDLQPDSDHVDVFRVATDVGDEVLARFDAVLSNAQRERAGRMRVRIKRDQFIIAQGLTRILLGRVLGADPASLEFTRGPKGKPYLGGDFAGAGVQFNMTHTSHMALVALSLGREVGIDIERVRDNLQWEKLARRYFSDSEYRGYAILPEERRLRTFFICWTRKEAVLKAIGTGLGGGLLSFDVSVDPDAPPVLLGNRWDDRFHGDWTLTALHPGPEYVATLVTERSGFEVRCWEGNGQNLARNT